MNAEPRGAVDLDPADAQIHERLARSFDAELRRAQRDYPRLAVARRSEAGRERTGRGSRVGWPKLASAVVAIGVFAVVGLIGVGLASRPGTVAGPGSAPPRPAVATIPAEIDGQKVYSVAEGAEWANLTGSFLLSAHVIDRPIPCPSAMQTPSSSAESDLVPECGVIALVDDLDPGQVPYAIVTAVAPKGRDLLTPWVGGSAIVMRVHTNDPEAAQCGAALLSQCEAALVVEAVVWPAAEPAGSPSATTSQSDTIPPQIDGEKVYRAADAGSFPTSGSFLLGGIFTRPDFMPPCPAPIDMNSADTQLVFGCGQSAIDGLPLAWTSTIDEPNNQILVARVHIHDPLAAQCSATYKDACEAAIVVESVVWRSNAVILPSPTAESSGATIPPISVPSETPARSPGASPVEIGTDGVPVTYDGETVYRAANLPGASTYLLGGVLGRDPSCTPATGISAQPPACGYWMVDGLVVGNKVAIPSSDVGSVVVVRIQVARKVATCVGSPCRTSDTLVVTEVVWVGPALSLTPPPPPSLVTSPPLPRGT
jgi:hypothetical protein